MTTVVQDGILFGGQTNAGINMFVSKLFFYELHQKINNIMNNMKRFAKTKVFPELNKQASFINSPLNAQ